MTDTEFEQCEQTGLGRKKVVSLKLFETVCKAMDYLLSSPVTDYKASVALLHNETEIVKKQHVITKIPLRWILNAQFINWIYIKK